jgi:hypothetical protein
MNARYFAVLSALLYHACLRAVAVGSLDTNYLAYELRTSVGAYETGGTRNPQWDEDAKKCLKAYARGVATKGATTMLSPR